MQVSIVSNNDAFINFFQNRSNSLQVLTRYRSLTDEKENSRFQKDFNHVDSFILLDFQDLSSEFKELLDFLTRGNSYFLNTEEILIISYKDAKRSPTPDLEQNLKAMQAYMDKLKINLRIVRLEELTFQEIYKSVIIQGEIAESKPKKFIKYKVSHSEKGVSVPPKKADVVIVPDKINRDASRDKREDLESARILGSSNIGYKSTAETERTAKEFRDYSALYVSDITMLFVTGVKYSGKTHVSLTLAKELRERGLSVAVVDLTGRKDLRTIANSVDVKLSLLKGLQLESFDGINVMGIEVMNKIYSSSFLTSVLKNVITNTSVVICEIDIAELKVIYESMLGNKKLLFVTPNSAVPLRESIEGIKSLNLQLDLVINPLYISTSDFNVTALRDSLDKVSKIYYSGEPSEIIDSLV